MRATAPGRATPISLRSSILAVVTVGLLLTGIVPTLTRPAAGGEHLVLRVGGQDEMKTRNPLPPIASDQWTLDVFERVYGAPMLPHPMFDVMTAYIAKGVDVDEDGTFEPATEYDVWWERRGTASTPLQVTAYYDFNGVRWHDGVQMTPWDLLFSYHLNVMNGRWSADLRVLLPGGVNASYEGGGRQLNVEPAAKTWEGEGAMPGSASLRVAVRFTLSEPFARFAEGTLAPVLLPTHIWSRTGGGRHADFGCAIWIPAVEATAKGIPECGTANPAAWGRGIPATHPVPGSSPYQYRLAEAWNLRDEDVIGSGPFRFQWWIPGVEARVARNDDYYVGGAYDSRLTAYLRPPRITGIVFKVYKTTQLGIFALQSGEIDFYHWSVGVEFVPDLLKDPNIGVEANPDPGYTYLGYNMRKEPWGGDVGRILRTAIAHAIDKKSIVRNLLQNFGIKADGFVSPSNTFWYNDNIPKPEFDLVRANAILDSPEARAVGIGPKPSGPCSKDTPLGCRSLGVHGTAAFEILVPQSDYDPVPAAAASMSAAGLREIGLNVAAKPMAYGAVFNRVISRDFDLYILGRRVVGIDPDYLFSFFHGSNAATGLNYGGADDPIVDACLANSRREMDRNARREIVFRCQQLFGERRPEEPLYYRTNIEAYRQDRFVNWSGSSGTIWNFWSILGIRPGGVRTLRIAINGDTVVPSEATTVLTFAVRSDVGDQVVGAVLTANLSAATGWSPGNLSAEGQHGTSVALTTDAGGRAFARYEAPVLYETTLPVIVRASATHLDYQGVALEETVLFVAGRDLTFLRIHIELPVSDLVYPETPLPVRIVVMDRWGAVPEARVAVEGYPGGTATPNAGTAQEVHTLTVTFPSTGVYTIGVNASKEGHRPAWAYVTVWAIEPYLPPGSRPPPPRAEDLSGWVAAAIALGLTATTAALVVWWEVRGHRGRSQGPRPPQT